MEVGLGTSAAQARQGVTPDRLRTTLFSLLFLGMLPIFSRDETSEVFMFFALVRGHIPQDNQPQNS